MIKIIIIFFKQKVNTTKFLSLIHFRERKEKNTIALKNAEISQNEERLKQQLRNESHELNEMCETIQKLTDERNELDARLNEYYQQIESVEDLKNEISDKNKVGSCFSFLNWSRQFLITMTSIFP